VVFFGYGCTPGARGQKADTLFPLPGPTEKQLFESVMGGFIFLSTPLAVSFFLFFQRFGIVLFFSKLGGFSRT